MEVDTVQSKTLIAQFRSESGETTGGPLDVPVDITSAQLETLINHLLNNDEKLPYSFFVNDTEVTESLQTSLVQQKISTEDTVFITYQPQAVFRVRSVTRCTGSLSGHTEAVLSVAFSPDGRKLASGSGDTTVRFWDVDTHTPEYTSKGHTNWVLFVSWAPNGRRLATGGMDNTIRLWEPATGKQVGQPLQGHTKFITSIAWEPLHMNAECTRLVSSSKDSTARIWDTRTGRCVLSLSGHTMSMTCVKWGGEGLIYTASQDRTIKVFEASTGKLCRTLSGHGHWVNTLALNTDYALRTGAYDHTGVEYATKEEAQKAALTRYGAIIRMAGSELLVSGSDDFTLHLWDPTRDKHPLTRMTGHQNVVNLVSYSPDGRLIASASFDKSIKLWNGVTGKFISSLRAHVEAVYQVAWSSDSRLLCSGSRDSTLKIWDAKTGQRKQELPGHADEVYSVDWSPDGQRVASGSKDRLLKIWQT